MTGLTTEKHTHTHIHTADLQHSTNNTSRQGGERGGRETETERQRERERERESAGGDA